MFNSDILKHHSKRNVKNSIDQSNLDLLSTYFSNGFINKSLNTVNERLGFWLRKTDEYATSSKKEKSKHIALFFDDNILN